MQDLFLAIQKVQKTHSPEKGMVQIGKISYKYHVWYTFWSIYINLSVVK